MIIITGATGWLGKTAVKYLLEKFDYLQFNENNAFSGMNLNINNNQIKVYNFDYLNLLHQKKKLHIYFTLLFNKPIFMV